MREETGGIALVFDRFDRDTVNALRDVLYGPAPSHDVLASSAALHL